MLGDHADSHLTASDHGKAGADIPLCAVCGNNEPAYMQSLAAAYARWTEAADQPDA